MARIIKSTREKIERLNKLVESNTELKDIVKQEWQGSHKAKNKWVDKFKEHLSESVLTALTESNTEDKEEKKTTECNTKCTTECNTESDAGTEAVMNYLKDKQNFMALQEIIEEYKKNGIKQELIIPTEYLTASTDIKSIRLNSKIYDEFTDFCRKKNLTIGGCINYALALFMEKFK